jgi:hypothetical protein
MKISTDSFLTDLIKRDIGLTPPMFTEQLDDIVACTCGGIRMLDDHLPTCPMQRLANL